MDKLKKKMLEKIGATQEDFEPKKETPTTEDLLEAINILTDIVLGGEEND